MNRPKGLSRGGPPNHGIPSRGMAFARPRPSLNGLGGGSAAASNSAGTVSTGAPTDVYNTKTHPSSRNKASSLTTFDQEMANFCTLIPSLSMLDSIITRDNSTLTAMEAYKESNKNPQDVISATYQDVAKRIETMEAKISTHKDERERRFVELSESFKGAIQLYVNSVISNISIPTSEEKQPTDSLPKVSQQNNTGSDLSSMETVPSAFQAWVSKEIDRKLAPFKEQIHQFFENQRAAREKSEKARDLAETEMRQKMDSMEKQLRILTMQQQENHQTFQQHGSKLQRVMDLQQSVQMQQAMSSSIEIVPVIPSSTSPLSVQDPAMPPSFHNDPHVHPDPAAGDRAHPSDPRLISRPQSSYSPSGTSPHYNPNQRSRYVTREELDLLRKESNQRISSRKKDLAEVKVDLSEIRREIKILSDSINGSTQGKRDEDGQLAIDTGSMAVDEVTGGGNKINTLSSSNVASEESTALTHISKSSNNNGDGSMSHMEWSKIKDMVKRRSEEMIKAYVDTVNMNVDSLREKATWLESRVDHLENEHAISQAKIERLSKR